MKNEKLASICLFILLFRYYTLINSTNGVSRNRLDFDLYIVLFGTKKEETNRSQILINEKVSLSSD